MTASIAHFRSSFLLSRSLHCVAGEPSVAEASSARHSPRLWAAQQTSYSCSSGQTHVHAPRLSSHPVAAAIYTVLRRLDSRLANDSLNQPSGVPDNRAQPPSGMCEPLITLRFVQGLTSPLTRRQAPPPGSAHKQTSHTTHAKEGQTSAYASAKHPMTPPPPPLPQHAPLLPASQSIQSRAFHTSIYI